MFRIFVNLNFWVSVPVFILSLSRGLMEQVSAALGGLAVSAKGRVTHSDLRKADSKREMTVQKL